MHLAHAISARGRQWSGRVTKLIHPRSGERMYPQLKCVLLNCNSRWSVSDPLARSARVSPSRGKINTCNVRALFSPSGRESHRSGRGSLTNHLGRYIGYTFPEATGKQVLLRFSHSSKRGIEATTTKVKSTAAINSAVNAASLISPLPLGIYGRARQVPNLPVTVVLSDRGRGINSRHAWLNRALGGQSRVGNRLALKATQGGRGPDGNVT